MTGQSLVVRGAADLIVSRPLDQNPAAVYLSSLAKGSRPTMTQCLNDMAAMLTDGQANAFTLNWGALRFQHATALRTKLAEKHSAATANKMLAALRGALTAAFNLGQIGAEDYLRAKSLKAVKGNSLPRGRMLSPKEIAAMLKTCAHRGTINARDGALLSLLYSCGLRREELCNLNLADYNPNDGSILVHGKGNKVRMGFVVDGAKKWLDAWLRRRGKESGALFAPVWKSNQVIVRRMTPQAVWNIVEKRAESANVKDVSPHDFRRTFVSQLLAEGVDISTVQRLAGHSNIQTTTRYDRRDDMVKAQAIKTLYVPYFAGKGRT